MYIFFSSLGSYGPGGVWLVEAPPPVGNNLRRLFLRLANLSSGSGEGLGGFYLTRSGDSFEASDLVGECFCPSLGFFGTDIGDDALSGEALGRYAYHYSGDSGWWFTCNCLGDSFPLSVASSSVDLGMPVMLAATTPMFSGGDIARGHVLRLERSTVLRHVFFDMLLVVPLKNLDVSSSGRALASSCDLDVYLQQPLVQWLLVEGLLHSPATKTTGRPLFGSICNFLFVQGCLCKGCDVNLDPYM